MRKLLLVAAIAAALPGAAFAQSAKWTINQTPSAVSAATGNDPKNIMATVAANPGLAEALNDNGVMVDQITQISILPNNIAKVMVKKN